MRPNLREQIIALAVFLFGMLLIAAALTAVPVMP